jgi:hypothetical protein
MNHTIPVQKCLFRFLIGTWLLADLSGQAAAQPANTTPSAPATSQATAAHYAKLDRVARELPNERAHTVPQLAASLAAHARTNNDKARLLFAWLAYHVAYDTEALRMGARQPNCSPAAVLRNRRAVCQGYANLFTAVARQMWLPAHTVTGIGRTSGGKISPVTNHAWNVYQANGRWHLVDATWGAGSVGNYRFGQRFSPFWFDASPTKFVFSHLPEDSTRQLLPQALSRTEFNQLPFAPAALLQLGPWEENLTQWVSPTREMPVSALPQAFDADIAVQIEQAPLWAELPRHLPVVFRFSVPPGVELSVEANGRFTVLEGSGGSRQATITPISGTVTVWAGPAAGSGAAVKSLVALLQYQVPAAEPARIARHRMLSTDTVAYLRR